MQKSTQHIYSFQSTDELVTVVVDSAVSLRVAASAPITIPLDKLELVHDVLTAVLADPDVAALFPVEEPVAEPQPEVEP